MRPKNLLYHAFDALILLSVAAYGSLNAQSLIYGATGIRAAFPAIFFLAIVAIVGAVLFSRRKQWYVWQLLCPVTKIFSFSGISYKRIIIQKAAILLIGSALGIAGDRYLIHYSMDGFDSVLKNNLFMHMASGVCALLTVVFFFRCAYGLIQSAKFLHNGAALSHSPDSPHSLRGTMIVAAVVLNLVAIIIVSNSATVYIWDVAGFWKSAISQSELLFGNLASFIKNVITSINTSDYNYLPVVLPALSAKLFGTSRLIFILSIINFYALPAIYVMSLASRQLLRMGRGEGEESSAEAKSASLASTDTNTASKSASLASTVSNTAAKSASMASTVSFTAAFLFLPLVGAFSSFGFLDIGGLVFCGFALFLYFGREESKTLFTYGAIGFLLCGMYLFRRWYLVWIIAFFVCSFLHQAFLCIKKEQKAAGSVFNLLAMGLSFFVPLTVFFHKLVVDKLLQTNYGNIYASYYRPLAVDLQSAHVWFGSIAIVLVLIFSIYLVLYPRTKKFSFSGIICGNYAVLFLLFHSVFTFFVFRTIQGHGQQHFFLYVPTFYLILAVGINKVFVCLFNRINSKKPLAVVIAVAFLVFAGLSYVIPFTHYDDIRLKAFPGLTMRTYKRYDIAELIRLCADLDRLSEGGDKTIALVASSLALNGDTLRNLEISINVPSKSAGGVLPSRGYIASGSEIDSRDGLPVYLYRSEYVVVADPVQLHLPPGNQTLVTIPAEEFLAGDTIGAAFERLDDTYMLDNGATIYIYKKTRAITPEEIAEFESKFKFAKMD